MILTKNFLNWFFVIQTCLNTSIMSATWPWTMNVHNYSVRSHNCLEFYAVHSVVIIIKGLLVLARPTNWTKSSVNDVPYIGERRDRKSPYSARDKFKVWQFQLAEIQGCQKIPERCIDGLSKMWYHRHFGNRAIRNQFQVRIPVRIRHFAQKNAKRLHSIEQWIIVYPHDILYSQSSSQTEQIFSGETKKIPDILVRELIK